MYIACVLARPLRRRLNVTTNGPTWERHLFPLSTEAAGLGAPLSTS